MLAQATIRVPKGVIRTREDFENLLIGKTDGLPVINRFGRLITVWESGVRVTGNTGRVKMTAKPELLLIDWDRPKPPAFPKIAHVLRTVNISPRYVRIDRTAKGWHLIVQVFQRLDPGAIIALQLLLGSDPKREAYNLCRALSGVKSNRWNLLFSEKLK